MAMAIFECPVKCLLLLLLSAHICVSYAGEPSSRYVRSATSLDHRGRVQKQASLMVDEATPVVGASVGKEPATLAQTAHSTPRDGMFPSSSEKKHTIQDSCGQPMLLSGRTIDLVISMSPGKPEAANLASLQGSSQSESFAKVVFALRSAERHGLLAHVHNVHVLTDEKLQTNSGFPLKHWFNRSSHSETPLDVNLVADSQIGVHFHQASAKLSAISKIPNIANWIFYLPDDVLLMDTFELDDFWDKHSMKPTMYAYDDSKVGWCDDGPPVGSFHGPVLLNRCFLQEVGQRYSDASYFPYSWAENQKKNMDAQNMDAICLYTKAVLDEGVAVSGGRPAWSRRCQMGSVGSPGACSANELLGIALEAPPLKFMKVEDAKMGRAAKDLGLPSTKADDGSACDQMKTREFFRKVVGNVSMSLEAAVGPAVSTDESWPFFCFTTPLLAKIFESHDSNTCAAAMIVVLCVSLFGLIWARRGDFHNLTKTELTANICVLFYMSLTIAVDVLIRRFHQQGIDTAFKFKPIVVVFFIEVGKLVQSCFFALVDWKRTRECSRHDFTQTMYLMAIPAVCYVALNLGRYIALSGADLDEYRVWRCTDIIFTAVLWFAMFKERPKFHQMLGIALIFCACALMHLQGKSTSVQWTWPIAVIVGIAFVSSLGLVTNEFGLKASANLSIFMQNIALYLVTCVLNGAIVVATVPMADVFQGIERPQMLLIALDILLGMCVACVLKYANAMVKQLASGWLAPLEPLIGHFYVGTAVTPIMVVGTMLAGAGSIIYRLDPTKMGVKK